MTYEAGRELDLRIAEEIFHWRPLRTREGELRELWPPDSDPFSPRIDWTLCSEPPDWRYVPYYSTDMAAAWEVEEAIRKRRKQAEYVEKLSQLLGWNTAELPTGAAQGDKQIDAEQIREHIHERSGNEQIHEWSGNEHIHERSGNEQIHEWSRNEQIHEWSRNEQIHEWIFAMMHATPRQRCLAALKILNPEKLPE